MNENINEEITNRIENIEDEELQSFLLKIVDYERDVLAQKKPHYKDEYRKLAKPHLDGGDGE